MTTLYRPQFYLDYENALTYLAGAASAETALRWEKALMDTFRAVTITLRPSLPPSRQLVSPFAMSARLPCGSTRPPGRPGDGA
jgi:hypothetical protein